MPSNPIRLVVFDWDGTVANSTQLIVDSWLHGFAAAGMSPLPAEADIRATIGTPLPLPRFCSRSRGSSGSPALREPSLVERGCRSEAAAHLKRSI